MAAVHPVTEHDCAVSSSGVRTLSGSVTMATLRLMIRGSWPMLSGLMALYSGVNRVVWSREEKAAGPVTQLWGGFPRDGEVMSGP